MVLLPRLSSTALVIFGSVLLHAGVAMALVSTGSGHARASVALPAVTLDVETVAEPLLEPVVEAPNVEAHEPAATPTHTHDYPVPPDHDAHPHDPSLEHEMLGAHPDDHHEEAPAPAAPVVTAPADPFASLPHFDLPSGAGAPAAHGSVSKSPTAAGNGAGVGLGGAGHDDDAIVPASGVQVPARLVSAVVASYPAGARADDVEGDVIVEVVLDRDGHVVDARVARPAGHGFDEAALSAIRRYRFSPAQREGHAVRVRMPWTVQFRLR